jgi:Domain of unknown function (DUF4157)
MFAPPQVTKTKAKPAKAPSDKRVRQDAKPGVRRWNEPGEWAEDAGPDPMRLPDRGAATAVSWDFSKIPVFSPGRSTAMDVPAPLQGAQPGLSAARVDDARARMPDAAGAPVKQLPELRRLESTLPVVRETLHSPGQPLDAATRQLFEPRFGWDFGRVRVHTDARAARSASALDARAFTFGERIVFGAGRYAPAGFDGRRLIAHELAHVIQQIDTGTPTIQRQPDSGSKEIEMPEENVPAEPTLIKSRRGLTDWIRDPSPSGSLDEKQWADGLKANDIAKLYADIAKVAHTEKVFEGPAAVPKTTDSINIVKDAKNGMNPGLNFSDFFMDPGGSFFVNPEGGKPFVGFTPSRTDPLPKVAIVLSKQAFSTKSVALGVLRHEMVHAEHLTMVLKEAQKWRADTKTKSSFEDWLNEQNKKGRLSDLDLLLVKDQLLTQSQTAPRAANTELLAYTEEFMTEFLLTRSPPADNNHPAFLPLFGVISSSSEPWANANTSVRAEALGRLQEYFCHVLDGPHQDAFKRFVSNPPSTQMPNVSWSWAKTRQMHQHFFDGLKKIIDNKCAGVGKRASK